MTPALVLVAELQARGVTLRPDGETLRVRPISKLSRAEVEALRRHKAEVLTFLTRLAVAEPTAMRRPAASVPASYAYPFPDVLPLGPRRVVPFTPCADCQIQPPPDRTVKIGPYTVTVPGDRGTWVAYGSTPLCLACARRRVAGRT